MIEIRQLMPDQFHQVEQLDVTETGTFLYRQAGTTLVTEPFEWTRRHWSPQRRAKLTETWARALEQGGAVLGGFDGALLVGEAVLLPRLTETMAQLQSLHINAACRRRGVARALVAEVIRLAREGGASQLYVSATPSESAVNFYRSVGFAPTASPHPDLLALEPADIHMTLEL